MLTYETEGWLEVAAADIQQLCRSTAAVSFGAAGSEAHEIQVALCDYLGSSEPCCRIAFYAKTLKRSLVFAVNSPEKQSPWQHGQEILARLGFQLEDINLKLSSAMQEVVLRDVPGLISPAEARKQRTEKELLLAELQDTYDKDPDSAQGKRAALKLRVVKRMNEHSEELRLFLELLLSRDESAQAGREAFASQLVDLTSRLNAAEACVEAERNQRAMSESITAAAEKRIQELEGILVDVETKYSEALKQKRKAAQLRERIKKLGAELASAEIETKKEREKQEQFMGDAKAAHERITLLEDGLAEAERALVNTQAQWQEEQVERTRLEGCLKESELRIKALNNEFKSAEKKAARSDEAVKTSGVFQDQLREQATTLTEQVTTLTGQKEQFTRELEVLRGDYDQECSLRKRLEEAAAEDDRRVNKLEDALAERNEHASTSAEDEKVSAEVVKEIKSLKIELQKQRQQLKDEQTLRKELESEANEAHKLIDSFEKTIRKTEKSDAERLCRETSKESESQKVQELEATLKSVKNQLEQKRVEQKRLAKAVAVAEKKLVDQEKRAAEQEKQLVQAQAERNNRKILEAAVEEEPVIKKRVKSSKILPHELRAAPPKGAFFRPDWDLEGLPCQSSEQIFKAWETVFNVQLSLEGYPSQYCMAFIVVLRLEKQKNLYMLYRLKKDKHTLVCVPAETIKDEASLKKAIKEGLKFLKMSGFEMEEMAAENIDSTLSGYFQGT
jgi:hypothetical protein